MKSIIIEHNDGKFLLYPQDLLAKILISGIISGESNEPHFKEVVKLINEDDIIIDGGGNLGYNSVIMGKRLGANGKLFSFEPQRIIFQQLNANMILNNIYNAYTYNLALSNVSGQQLQMEPINYDVTDINIGGYSIGSGGENVRTIKIDDLNLPRLNFIKLDIQGYEIFAIEGGIETIKKYKPDIFIEIEDYQLGKFGKTPDDLILLIKSLGYSIYKLNFEPPFLYRNYDHICTINNVTKVENLNIPLIKI